MSDLSDFDKELIERNENTIRMLQKEKQHLFSRLLSIYKEIKTLRGHNREIKKQGDS